MPPGTITEESIAHMQRKVSQVVLSLVAKGDGGEELCEISAGPEPIECAQSTLKALIFQLVEQWAEINNGLISYLHHQRFGHLSDEALEKFDAVSLMGFSLLEAVKMVDETSEYVLDLTATLGALRVIRNSYEFNPADKQLDSLTVPS